MNSNQQNEIATRLFAKADKDGSKTLNFEETKKILQKLHIEITKNFLNDFFQKYDTDKNNCIDQREFEMIINDITKKKEIIPIFQKYCEKGKAEKLDYDEEIMTEKEFKNFLMAEQKETLTTSELKLFIDLIKKIENIDEIKSSTKEENKGDLNSSSEKLRSNKISLYQFSNMLFSMGNRICTPLKENIYQVELIILKILFIFRVWINLSLIIS